MTTEQRIINAQIRHALTTGAVPIEITDAPERDGAIRNLVYETGVKVGEKFTVTKKGVGVWSIDIASEKTAKK
jgi:hypothetical protein